MPGAEHERVARMLTEGELRVILLGALAERHVAYSEIRALAAALAEVTGARLGFLPEGANAVGASLAGVMPHRGAGGRAVAKPGLAAAEMIDARLRAYVLVGGIETEDLPAVVRRRGRAAGRGLRRGADAVRRGRAAGPRDRDPAGRAFAETSGTWVNVEGRWQSVPGAARPAGEARPAWKVLRVLGNLLGLHGFDYLSSEEVRDELRRRSASTRRAAVAGGLRAGAARRAGCHARRRHLCRRCGRAPLAAVAGDRGRPVRAGW